MSISPSHKSFIDARPLAKLAGTEELLLALQGPLAEFGTRIGCDDLGSSGKGPRGIPFRLKGRKEDLFAFWVERRADKRHGLAAISFDPKRFRAELRPAFRQLIEDLRRRTGQILVKNGTYKSEAIGFASVEDGLAVLNGLDEFIGSAMAHFGAEAFAPYDPKALAGESDEDELDLVLTVTDWDSDEAPPGVDPIVWAQIRVRQGQQQFRKALLAAYERKCAITHSSVVAALQAAHVTPYSKDAAYGVTDGLLLRADIHILFDLHLIAVNPSTMTVHVAPALQAEYGEWDGQPLRLPFKVTQHPRIDRLGAHFENWMQLTAHTTRGRQ